MPAAEQVDQLALHVVCVLIFVDEDELKLGQKVGPRLLVFAQQSQPLVQQVVEIHHPVGLLALGVGGVHPGDVLRQTLKIKVPFLHHLR